MCNERITVADRDKMQRAATFTFLNVAACERQHLESQRHHHNTFAFGFLNLGSCHGSSLW